jgi:AraC family transcriptional regulator, regulatory protein of adaptative response / methylated-DNA-[protein]-cysteine methyltransferase
MTPSLSPTLTDAEMRAAWSRRDASFDGLFCFGVRTTGIFCRPSCPSRPKPEHLEFFRSIGDAVRAGYRPCKRCAPEHANGAPPKWVAALMERAASAPTVRITAQDLRELGIAPEKVRRWFQKNHGMTFAAWCRGLRLSGAFTQIRRGAELDDVILGHGYESHSGFRAAFARVFGRSPGRAKDAECLLTSMIETPVGPMLAVVSGHAVCQLEFADRRGLEASYTEMRRRFALPVVPGENAVMAQLRVELGEYFAGKLRAFTLTPALLGTSFQQKVWRALMRIPFGQTASYEDLARQLGAPTATRAVAQANGANRLYLLVPCHRVIGKDGTLTGYGGGVWRKRLLLELEQRGRNPRIEIE